ncbi:hypothetical protein C0Z16_23230 [Paraburkholderia rhynchosiae]|uniref:Uncharacterized protein n=1 Tax=Paraburkholderia rhynchosiae TaxID=487049 RepID=A0ABX4V016_9BURK|nr:hypothetical protein C0Z16_23230 [Paraburkholderia rhynchosiae]
MRESYCAWGPLRPDARVVLSAVFAAEHVGSSGARYLRLNAPVISARRHFAAERVDDIQGAALPAQQNLNLQRIIDP